LSIGTNSFKYDLGREDHDGNQGSEVSVFVQDHGKIRHFYAVIRVCPPKLRNAAWTCSIPSGTSSI
jgi:hypothetical protein